MVRRKRIIPYLLAESVKINGKKRGVFVSKGKRQPLVERFWEKVNKTEGCWLWTAAKKQKNYGMIGVLPSRNRLAHRVSWELHNGPIPQGMKVLHKCDNPPCVRPEHLFLGTHQDNMRDMVSKHRGSTCGGNRRKLSESQVQEIRKRRAAGEREIDLAAAYNVKRWTIGNIISRRSWAKLI